MTDEELMEVAVAEARLATEHNDVPIGAAIAYQGKVIAQRHNERELHQDPTAHAEILVLRDAAAQLGQWRLSDCTMAVTLEPCSMCAGACVAARLGQLLFAATDLKAGAVGSRYNICCDPRLNHEVPTRSGVLEAVCSQMLVEFFQQRRRPGPPIA